MIPDAKIVAKTRQHGQGLRAYHVRVCPICLSEIEEKFEQAKHPQDRAAEDVEATVSSDAYEAHFQAEHK